MDCFCEYFKGRYSRDINGNSDILGEFDIVKNLYGKSTWYFVNFHWISCDIKKVNFYPQGLINHSWIFKVVTT